MDKIILLNLIQHKTDFRLKMCVFQCHGSSGHCWCVDSRGQERAGTRTLPGAPPTDCDKPGEKIQIYMNRQASPFIQLHIST